MSVFSGTIKLKTRNNFLSGYFHSQGCASWKWGKISKATLLNVLFKRITTQESNVHLNGDIKHFIHTQKLEQSCIINSTKAVAFTWVIPLYGFIHICSIKSVSCLDVVGWHTLYSVSVNNTTGKYYTIAYNFKNVHRTTLVHNSSFDSNWTKQKQAESNLYNADLNEALRGQLRHKHQGYCCAFSASCWHSVLSFFNVKAVSGVCTYNYLRTGSMCTAWLHVFKALPHRSLPISWV